MATCKDCIHTDVCRLSFNTSEIKVEVAHVCHYFINKAQTVSKTEKVAPIDVVEVVRCEKCVYATTIKDDDSLKDYVWCYRHGDRLISKDNYCSFGKRRCDNDTQ